MLFTHAYKLTNPAKNYMTASQIVVGVRPMAAGNGVEFLTAGESGHYIVGKLKKRDEGFEIVDKERVGLDGNPAVWFFEDLTLDSWQGMRGSVVGFDMLRKDIVTYDLLQNFYVENFLHDWWTEQPEK